jgi:hypothetical protein
LSGQIPLATQNITPDKFAYQSRFPPIVPSNEIANLGTKIDQLHLDIIKSVVEKRKHLRDLSIKKLEEMIVYCDNKILDIGPREAILSDQGALKMAAGWQQKIIDLELAKIGEQKELFRDTLFLRNEWVKAILSYTEQKSLENTIHKALRGENE